MHKTLSRQIGRTIENAQLSPEFGELLSMVSETYSGFDADRKLIERSLEISSSELKSLVSLLQATLDSINEGIIVIDDEQRLVNHNKRFQEIWELPDTLMNTRDSQRVFLFALEKVINKAALKNHIGQTVTNSDQMSLYVVAFKNNKTVEMRSRPQVVDGVNVGRVWSCRDITDQLKIEDELKTKIGALERMNRAMINRELKMIELKQKIASLEARQ